MENVSGQVEKITFRNDDNGFSVILIQESDKDHLTCIVGMMSAVNLGEVVSCQGKWKCHPIYGSQFEVETYHVQTPATVVGIEKYLSSGLIKGIGPIYAKKIVDHFGLETLNIIDFYPEELLSIEGLGKKRLQFIKSSWKEHQAIREIMIILQQYGVSPTLAQKIFKIYGEDSARRLRESPFQIAKDIFGIGFKTADLIAKNMGISHDDPLRLEAGMEYLLGELSSEGHMCFPLEDLVEKGSVLLEVDEKLLKDRLVSLKEQKRVEIEEMLSGEEKKFFVWLKSLYLAEIGVAAEIQRIQESKFEAFEQGVEREIHWTEEKFEIELALMQKRAVEQAFLEKMHIITGGPGTGKSTIIKVILEIERKRNTRILLAAPTGRAAKRMAEITGKKASTIHSLLEYDPILGTFVRNRHYPLDCGLIIIDEASMIDTLLMYNLLKAIPDSTRIIFVGDIDQLPSVGPGNVLKDIIASRIIKMTTLEHIFRQAAGSKIVMNAHKIKNGLLPDLQNEKEGDFFFIEEDRPEDIADTLVTLVSQRLPLKYDFNPLSDIQVLSPMKKGIIGIENLNTMLQKTLNPNRDGLLKYGKIYAPGDKVMQIRNNYQKQVFNGDQGIIKSIDTIEQRMVVEFDERLVEYDSSDFDEVVLAYAVSVHKYQGSECPCIVIPIHTSHFILLNRNLFYTAVTRGKKLVVIIGTKKAIGVAARRDDVRKRYSGLFEMLKRAAVEISSLPLG